MGTDTYLLDKEHLPIHPDFEDNQVAMNENEPSLVQAQAKKEKARKEKAAKMPTQEEASEYFLKNKQEQLSYLIASTLRIEKGLATLTQNQESLERIVEQKFYDLDVKVTEIQQQWSNFKMICRRGKGKLPLMHLPECHELRGPLQCQFLTQEPPPQLQPQHQPNQLEHPLHLQLQPCLRKPSSLE